MKTTPKRDLRAYKLKLYAIAYRLFYINSTTIWSAKELPDVEPICGTSITNPRLSLEAGHSYLQLLIV